MAKTIETQFGEKFLDDIIDYIRSHFRPEEIYEDRELSYWAEANGYIKEV